MKMTRTLCAVLLALAAMTATARAEQTPEQVTEARQHYERGMTHYQLGEFKAAVDEFKQAYALAPAPGLLFNLAQASRLGKQYEQALYFYRTYLRVAPEAQNRTDVEQRIAELEPLAKRQQEEAAAAERTRREAALRPEPDTRATAPRPNGRALKLSGIVIGALGLAALGAGIGLGVTANNEQNKLSNLAKSMGTWSPSQTNDYNRGRTEAAAATGLYIAGGVAAGTGVLLYVLGWQRDRAARFAFVPAPGGAMASGTWSF
jgi:tetratricopeptide (TPR) repeat protein